jgi:RimJ/RimL family protein N-acetyltransferase
MMPLETERLLLRRLTPADLDEFVALHRDPEVVRFVRSLDRAQAEERLRANEREWVERGHGMLAILARDDGRFLGRVGLKYWPQFGETEAGWLLRRDAWGQGYATEAARACVDRGFATLPVSYITAMIHPQNTRSTRVARRLGFAPAREDVLLGDPVIVHTIEREDRDQQTPSSDRRAAAAEDLARVGGSNAPVEIVDYDPAWPTAFEARGRVSRSRRREAAGLRNRGSP